MKRNILLVADGDIQSDLDVIDAAARTGHGLRRASASSRPSQILRRRLQSFDAIVVDLDKHGHTLSILEALGASESSPPVIALTTPDMVPVAYQHGATACVAKPFDAAVLASVIGNLCAHAHLFAPEHLPEPISIVSPKASLREPPD